MHTWIYKKPRPPEHNSQSLVRHVNESKKVKTVTEAWHSWDQAVFFKWLMIFDYESWNKKNRCVYWREQRAVSGTVSWHSGRDGRSSGSPQSCNTRQRPAQLSRTWNHSSYSITLEVQHKDTQTSRSWSRQIPLFHQGIYFDQTGLGDYFDCKNTNRDGFGEFYSVSVQFE